MSAGAPAPDVPRSGPASASDNDDADNDDDNNNAHYHHHPPTLASVGDALRSALKPPAVVTPPSFAPRPAANLSPHAHLARVHAPLPPPAPGTVREAPAGV